MKGKSWIKMGFKLTKFIIVVIVVMLLSATVSNKKIFRVENFNFNRSFELTAMAVKDEEEKPVEEVKSVVEEKKDENKTETKKEEVKVEKKEDPKKVTTTTNNNILKGSLTGYAADCPKCNGTLACKTSYKVYKNNVVAYPDTTFGSVRIVASSKNLPCGSIIKFESNRVGSGTTYAIVLDRGVTGNNIDLLVPSESYALKNIGRSTISYEVIRRGW